MKRLLLTLMVFGAFSAQAKESNYKFIIKREPASTKVTGFTDALYGRHSRSCFSGSANEVCSKVKSEISRANGDLSGAGAGQRFNMVTCAQNPNRAMVIFSVNKTKKTVFIDRCNADDESQQIASTLSN